MLEIKNLSITYKSTKHKVIDNLSVNIGKGDFLAIMGPSGCGKTTLASVIQGTLGTLASVEGDIVHRQDLVIRTVFQEPSLLPWLCVKDNSLFGISSIRTATVSDKEFVQGLAERFGLKSFLSYLPSKLSRGMKQRVNFIRAVSVKPDLLILDEPFSSLDVVTKKLLIQYLLEVQKTKETAILLVTHSKEEAKTFTDKVITLVNNV